MSGTTTKKSSSKKSGKAQLREEGLEKTDNSLSQTSWPVIGMINQKNYYTEYLKREDQYLAFRTLQEENTNKLVQQARDRDRALAQGTNGDHTGEVDEDLPDEESGEEPPGAKIIVVHPGSQFLRIGFANDALPKTVPMVIARKSKQNESEENGGEPLPKRVKIDGEIPSDTEKLWGKEWGSSFREWSADLKIEMRNNRIRLVPGSKELVSNYNKRKVPEIISEHNDPDRLDWTEIPAQNAPGFITGNAALRIPEKSRPRYKLFWPVRDGWPNETAYNQKNALLNDFFTIIEEAMRTELRINPKDLSQYSCVFIIPDIYEKVLVSTILDEFLRVLGFRRVSFIQESLAASFGAGYSISCVVDVGASKTSICCVEDGMCVEDSRINLKYGGYDVTETFIKMTLQDHFPYSDINLKRRHDFLLAEELKQKYCHLNQAEIALGTHEFHLRAAGQDTQKFSFRFYDEVYLSSFGYFNPTYFDFNSKLDGRRSLIERSYDLYDGSPNDPTSLAQTSVLTFASENYPSCRSKSAPTNLVLGDETNVNKAPLNPNISATGQPGMLARLKEMREEDTPRSSVAGSPAPEGNTPKAEDGHADDANGAATSAPADPILERIRAAEESDQILPVMPLDQAILLSVRLATKGEEKKMRDFLGGIMVVGGGAKMPGFNTMLEMRLRQAMPGFTKEILVGMPPRELDQQLVVWKGGSVFGRLSSTGNDTWVFQKEYEILGSKLLTQKLMFAY